jgi:hypothetical protein
MRDASASRVACALAVARNLAFHGNPWIGAGCISDDFASQVNDARLNAFLRACALVARAQDERPN